MTRPFSPIPSPAKAPACSLTWKARIWTGRYRVMDATPLGILLRLLPFMPLPDKGATLRRVEIAGALLEADLNLHTIERHLGQLLQPALPDRGKKAGWLALCSNGGGGYWFEVLTDFGEAVDLSLDALQDLGDELPAEDELTAELAREATKLSGWLDEITEAHADVKALAARLRGRR